MPDTVTKPQLRAAAAQRRAVAFDAHPLAGDTLSAVLPRAELPLSGSVVAGYVPFRSEIDPAALMHRLALAGARLALPVTPERGSDEPLSFRLWAPHDQLARGHFAIHEPGADAPEVIPDLILVPLLAFDRRGHRLGYGAGHFDRTLERLRALRPVRAIGLAFAAQEVEALPDDPHDQPLDAILTERAYIAIGSSRMTP